MVWLHWELHEEHFFSHITHKHQLLNLLQFLLQQVKEIHWEELNDLNFTYIFSLFFLFRQKFPKHTGSVCLCKHKWCWYTTYQQQKIQSSYITIKQLLLWRQKLQRNHFPPQQLCKIILCTPLIHKNKLPTQSFAMTNQSLEQKAQSFSEKNASNKRLKLVNNARIKDRRQDQLSLGWIT